MFGYIKRFVSAHLSMSYSVFIICSLFIVVAAATVLFFDKIKHKKKYFFNVREQHTPFVHSLIETGSVDGWTLLINFHFVSFRFTSMYYLLFSYSVCLCVWISKFETHFQKKQKKTLRYFFLMKFVWYWAVYLRFGVVYSAALTNVSVQCFVCFARCCQLFLLFYFHRQLNIHLRIERRYYIAKSFVVSFID